MTIKKIIIFISCVLLCNVYCNAQERSKIDRSNTGTSTKTSTSTGASKSSKSSQPKKTTTAQSNTLSVSSSSLSFPASGGSKTITVKASSSWEISVKPNNWGHLTRNDNMLTLTVEENTFSSSRADYFDISSGDKTVRVRVSQDKANILKVSSENLSFSASGGSQTVKVTASGTWSLGTNISAWGHLEQKGDTIKVCVEPNNTSSIREDHFVITSGTKKVRVNISQEKVNTLSVSAEQLYFPPAGGVKSVTVEASNPWDCGIKTYSWGHLTISGNIVVVSVASNSNTNERGGYFIIKSGDLEKRINILQSAYTAQELKRIEKENKAKYKKQLKETKKKKKELQVMKQSVAPEIADRETITNNKPISRLSQRPLSEPTGYVNGHEWVDLGLSVKWATCNIGAESPYNFGDYYAWGEKKTKEEFSMENSLTYKINSDSIAGVGVYDAAKSNWGGTWRLPTVYEFNELIENCKFEWSSRDGHQGYSVTGPSGESIFIPAAGWRCELDLTDAGEKGLYWSSTLIENNPLYAYGLYFFEGYFCSYWINHRIGGTVRPVTE